MNKLLLTMGLIVGATALNVEAQDRSHARQNGESRMQSSERSRGNAPAPNDHKRGDNRQQAPGISSAPARGRGNEGRSERPDVRRDARDDRYSYGSGQADQRRYDNHAGRSNQQRGSNDHRRSQSDYRYRDSQRGHAPSYGAHDYRHDRRDYRHDRRDYWRTPSWRSSWSHGWGGHRYRTNSHYYYPSGYSSFRWTIGLTLPRAFYRSNYYVNYDAYGLAPPPYGTRWLRVDSDLLLVDSVSYEIVEVLRGFYY